VRLAFVTQLVRWRLRVDARDPRCRETGTSPTWHEWRAPLFSTSEIVLEMPHLSRLIDKRVVIRRPEHQRVGRVFECADDRPAPGTSRYPELIDGDAWRDRVDKLRRERDERFPTLEGVFA
jgi:hypothetical protein